MKIQDFPHPLNSREYWDQRFSQDWQNAGGPQQSAFFARMAKANLPAWLFEFMRLQNWSLADWGCAEGEATAMWAQQLRPEQVCGIDFSDEAIAKARAKFPQLCFHAHDWLTQTAPDTAIYDVVFSSNTLEHFHQPMQVLERLSTYAGKLLILMLPFREAELEREHFFRFDRQHIPFQLQQSFQLVWSKVIDCREQTESYWQGEQIVLIYAASDWLRQHKLSLADLTICDQDLQPLQDWPEQKSVLQNQLSQWQERCNQTNEQLQQRHTQLQSMAQQLGLTQQQHQSELERWQQQLQQQQQRAEQKFEELQRHHQSAQNDLHEELNLTRLDYQQGQDKLNEMQQALGELQAQLHAMQYEMHGLRHSYSWGITRPLRFASQFINAPGKASYKLAKHIFWKLPGSWRWALHKPRHQFVRWVRANPLPLNSGEPANPGERKKNLSWPEFEQQILSRRDTYPGIFVQELVIDWNVPLYQRPQHIANAFARLGYLVIYRTDNWSGDNVDGCQEVMPNVWLSNCKEVSQLQNVVRSLYSTAHFFTPESIARPDQRGCLIYEYIDHIDPQISGDEANIKRLLALKEFAFSGGADYIIASARKLADEAIATVGPEKVILAQNGVDTRHYRSLRHLSVRLPQNLLNFRQRYQQVVGYFGALAPWLWYDVIQELVALRPDTGFVFIGPDYFGGSTQLPQADNVLYLGSVDYQILPAYARQFDICLIPFAPGEIARTTSPLKLFEYFALEKPVVVTSEMAECVQYPEVFRGHDIASLSQAIDQAWAVRGDAGFKQKLANLADQNDWDKRALAMAEVFKKLDN